jgi:hypothetical protein
MSEDVSCEPINGSSIAYSTVVRYELIARNNIWSDLGLLLAPDTGSIRDSVLKRHRQCSIPKIRECTTGVASMKFTIVRDNRLLMEKSVRLNVTLNYKKEEAL